MQKKLYFLGIVLHLRIESNATIVAKQVVLQDGGCCYGSSSPENGLYIVYVYAQNVLFCDSCHVLSLEGLVGRNNHVLLQYNSIFVRNLPFMILCQWWVMSKIPQWMTVMMEGI